jgi:hypothetical protein
MANEAEVITLLGNNHDGDPISLKVYDSQSIAKGTILAFSGATVKAASADNDVFCGIAAVTKEASNGETTISAWTNGIFKMYFDAAVVAVTPGLDVTVSAANTLKIYTTLDDEKGYKVGKALETVAAAGNKYAVRVLF